MEAIVDVVALLVDRSFYFVIKVWLLGCTTSAEFEDYQQEELQ